jgi:hypothetical protein
MRPVEACLLPTQRYRLALYACICPARLVVLHMHPPDTLAFWPCTGLRRLLESSNRADASWPSKTSYACIDHFLGSTWQTVCSRRRVYAVLGGASMRRLAAANQSEPHQTQISTSDRHRCDFRLKTVNPDDVTMSIQVCCVLRFRVLSF